MLNRIVITGIGVISPIGTGKEKFWKALINGKNGIRKCRKLNTADYRTHIAAEVDDFNPQEFIDFRKINHPTIATQYAIVAAKMALDDSGLKINPESRIGVVFGNTADPLPHADAITFWSRNKYSYTPESIYENLNTNLFAVRIAEYFGLKGPCAVIPGACAAGNMAISYAFDLIKSGHAASVFAGGVEPLNYAVYAGFNKMRAMAPDCCQPFDRDRKGMVIGEGAGVVLLEDMERALKRKAKIYAEILGYGLSCDAHHISIPDPQGKAAILATEMALKMSGVKPKDIDYINAHGTGTIANDRMEARVIKTVFKDNGNDVCVSSIKSMLGHCMEAASGIEACACALIIERGIIPPNINYHNPDSCCDINIVANSAIKKKVKVVLSNSFAFGGNNAILVMAKLKRTK